MKRDMDLIRAILIGVEDDPALNGSYCIVTAADLGVSEYEELFFAYNAALLVEAGLLDGNTERAEFGDVILSKLTWNGHEFLDTIRDPDIWKKTKAGLLAGGGFSLDLLKDLARGFVRKQIEERTGVKL